MQKRKPNPQTMLINLFTIILLLMFSGCSKLETVEVSEQHFHVDYLEEMVIRQAEQVFCNQESAWAITTVKNDFIYQFVPNTGAGLEKIEWQLEGEKATIVNIAEQKGKLYAAVHNQTDNTLEIRSQCADGMWDTVFALEIGDKDGYTIVGSGFFVDSKENVYLVNEATVARFDSAGNQTATFALQGKVCFFQENAQGTVECVTVGEKDITLYEFAGKQAEEKWTLTNDAALTQVCGIYSNQDEMLCLATSTRLMFLDKATGNLISYTDLVKLGVFAVLTGYYDAEEESLQLYTAIGNDSEGLRYSLLNKSDAATEQRTELVYGVITNMNTYDGASMRNAINIFNQENKDYYVTIRDYGGVENLDRLHADMAAGNGPDIIDMMYSDYYESYVKNGYLEDLTPYFERSQYKDDIIWNVMDSYKIDGKLYLMVPHFQVYGLLIHPEYESTIEEWNMDTFLAFLEQNQWEKSVFGELSGNAWSLLHYMMCGRQEEFVDWEQQKASFETEVFMNMLALCKEYAEEAPQDSGEMTMEGRAWNTLCTHMKYAGEFYFYLDRTGIYGREYPIYGYPTLSGQVYGLNACSDSCAIYAGSEHKEGAWQFIESLLLEANQEYRTTAEPGFPIRSSILKKRAADAKTVTMRVDSEELTITDAEIAILENIIYNEALTSNLMDPNIESVIWEEAESYFAGDKSAQETAHIIQNRVQLILEE